jgi:2-keto-4-pentenoate hydratase/2-oxohepta-3-ene-1,7-dioic acid hydratase in catechol pathway
MAILRKGETGLEKYIRFEHRGEDRFGRVNDQKIELLNRPFWQSTRDTGETVDANGIKPLCPVIPSKIVLVGLNYHAHVKESQSATKAPKNPVLFLKPPSSLIGPGDEIQYPNGIDRVDYEAELAVVIGKEGRHIPVDRMDEYIFGYTCLNDVTARHVQKQDGQWTRGKGFDTFCPVGPYVVKGVDASDLSVEAYLNGEQRQSGRTSDMIFPIPNLLSFISSVMTLVPGDIISTGTPQGIDPMQKGDTIEIRIEQIGSLINKVA